MYVPRVAPDLDPRSVGRPRVSCQSKARRSAITVAYVQASETPTAAGPLLPGERGEVVRRVLQWYRSNARDLPWRRAEVTPWQVMISEFMLQQTPVARVQEPWRLWVERWPTPSALAATPAGEAVRAWGRLGYPRRALRLHAAASVITSQHDGDVPADKEELLRLPGIGEYTAAAISAFAYSRREVVLDTNVRRVLSRISAGLAFPPPTVTAAERAQAQAFLPRQGRRAARWAVASMELGALVCTAQAPRCASCPVSDLCRWRRNGHRTSPADPRRRNRSYEGTDRQCRGALLAAFRAADEPISLGELQKHWPDAAQRARALASLITDGLVINVGERHYRLPG
jgi:A/G-specific adenine glycosylase